MRMYCKYLSLQLKTAFEYRASLVFDMISSMLSTIACFCGILALFTKYQTIAGYTINEVLVTYSLISFAFAVSECFFRGFDQFDKLVRTGELDRLLIRPRSVFMQVLGYKVEFNKFGRIFFSAVILIVALIKCQIEWTAMKVFVLIFMIFGAITIFAGMFLLYSAVSIFTVEGLEAMNVITCGGRDMCYYPLDVYSGVLRKFFTYIIPLAVVNYLPLQYLLGMNNAGIMFGLSPLFAIVFFAICYLIFRWSLTKYKSTGS